MSGCIVTYNNEDIIEECIKSILAQTKGVDFTLYVSDNASTDNTVSIIRQRFPQVRLICGKKNIGFGQGHNRVLPLLNSDYHVVINPDITLQEDAISGLVRYMEQRRTVGMVSPRVLNPDGSEQFLPKTDPCFRYVILSKLRPFAFYRRAYTRQDENIARPVLVDSCSGSFFVVRTALFQELKGFDARFFMYCEDADFSRRVRAKASLVFNPDFRVTHLWKRDNTKTMRGMAIFMMSYIRYCLKWMD